MRIFLYLKVLSTVSMAGESQLTFNDVFQSDAPEEIYDAVSTLADRLVDADRERVGDNCATVSQRKTDVEGEFVFCIQLPPRTNSFTMEEFEIESVTGVTIEFIESTVRMSEDPTQVIWRFLGKGSSVSSLQILVVKPIEELNIEEAEADENEVHREAYTQFDFTEFVRDE